MSAIRPAPATDAINLTQQAFAAVCRERDEAREELQNWKPTSIHSCHSECKRPLCVANRQIAAMREAIKEAHEALMLAPYRDQEALAKLQPFLKP